MILGVGGGLGAGYILWEFEAYGYRALTLGFRRLWQYPARWASETAERLGLHAELHETGGARGAAEALDAQLDRGLPAIAWIDTYQLGLRGEPESLDGRGGDPLIVYGRSGDTYEIDDRSLRARDGAARAPGGGTRPRRLLQAPPDHDRPRARRPRRRPAARGRHGWAPAAGRTPQRVVVVLLAARLAQVGAHDHRHPQRQGLAARVRRRARDREHAGFDLHRRVGRREPARALRRLPRRGRGPALAPWAARARTRMARGRGGVGRDRRHRAPAGRRAPRADRPRRPRGPLGAPGRARHGRRAPARSPRR